MYLWTMDLYCLLYIIHKTFIIRQYLLKYSNSFIGCQYLENHQITYNNLQVRYKINILFYILYT